MSCPYEMTDTWLKLPSHRYFWSFDLKKSIAKYGHILRAEYNVASAIIYGRNRRYESAPPALVTMHKWRSVEPPRTPEAQASSVLPPFQPPPPESDIGQKPKQPYPTFDAQGCSSHFWNILHLRPHGQAYSHSD
jgi:hypothetical protein